MSMSPLKVDLGFMTSQTRSKKSILDPTVTALAGRNTKSLQRRKHVLQRKPLYLLLLKLFLLVTILHRLLLFPLLLLEVILSSMLLSLLVLPLEVLRCLLLFLFSSRYPLVLLMMTRRMTTTQRSNPPITQPMTMITNLTMMMMTLLMKAKLNCFH